MHKRFLYFLFCFVVSAAVIGLSSLGSRTVTVLSEQEPIERSHRIIIDPGHGGEDGGTSSQAGKPESEYNLQISLRLNDLFQLLGYETRMTRTENISIYTKGETLAQKKVSDLKERVRIVQETENALLLSIHQNHFTDSRYSGAQVFYAPTAGSEALAKQIQTKLGFSLNEANDRQCKKSSGIYLMEHIPCTGVLIECGFLSNAEEAAKLCTEEYQKKICCIIVSGVSEHLSNT